MMPRRKRCGTFGLPRQGGSFSAGRDLELQAFSASFCALSVDTSATREQRTRQNRLE